MSRRDGGFNGCYPGRDFGEGCGTPGTYRVPALTLEDGPGQVQYPWGGSD